MPPLKQVRATVAHEFSSHPEHHFLESALVRDLNCFGTRRWETGWDAESIPGERLLQARENSGAEQLVVALDGAIAHVIYTTYIVRGTVAAASMSAVEEMLEAVEAALPPKEITADEVPVTFWWQDATPSHAARKLPTLDWEEIRNNYTQPPRRDLEELAGWTQPPKGGRLIVWHGEPGTGKTTALRHLAGAWRAWAELHFITDPERFLRSSPYLLEVVAADHDRRRRGENASPPGKDRPWRVIVLEDAGEFVAPDAKHEHGQAISRLLNVCDGILGEAMRCLVILTTNEPLRRLDPALTRPGRLLRSTEFTRFDSEEAEAWLAMSESSEPWPISSPQTLADLYAIAEDRTLASAVSANAIGFAA